MLGWRGKTMEQSAIERAIRRAHRRANHEARQMALAIGDRARRAHECRLGQLRRQERDALLTYQAFGFDLEGGDYA